MRICVWVFDCLFDCVCMWARARVCVCSVQSDQHSVEICILPTPVHYLLVLHIPGKFMVGG